MTLAIMQPYFFPYIGYFQLIHSADRFVFYDDVNFIKQGWINRNRILLNGKDFLFSIPIENISSYQKIKQTKLNESLFLPWKKKFLNTLKQAYIKAPHYEEVNELFERVLNISGNETIATVSTASIIESCKFIGLNKEFVYTSSVYGNDNLKSENRVIDICKKENATTYINMSGGKEIYNKNKFYQNGIELSFLNAKIDPYKQLSFPFVPGLSIIDVLMYNHKETVYKMIKKSI